MKKAILFVLLCIATVGTAQTPEQVVAEYLNAIGGKEKLEQIRSITADIAVVSNGLAMDGRMAFSFPDKQYSEMNVRGEKIITVLNGVEGWMVNPLTGSSAPIPMTKEQIRTSQKSLSTEQLLDPSEYTIEDLGERQVRGQNYRVLNIVFNSGDEPAQKRYFNTRTRLIDFVEMDTPSGGSIIMAYEAYAEVNGIKFPTTVLSYTDNSLENPSMTMELKNMKINVPVDSKLFQKPQ